MRLFLRYLKDRRRTILIYLLFCCIFTAVFMLYRLPAASVLYPASICALIGCIALATDFYRVKREHDLLSDIRTITDAASSSLDTADGLVCSDMCEIIRLICDEHNLFRSDTSRKYTDMVEYYTLWAHQIKTPIASMRLQLQSEDSELSRRLTSELHRIEQYVDMVLTFLRLDSDTTDYVFREYELDSIVRSVIKKFSSDFIASGLSLAYEPIEARVVTDEKWLSFVLEQVLSNALKYTPSGSITISLDDAMVLRVEDTGIGIAAEDLPRIFEKGYTGYNGRTDRKSSGIGLYLCRRICNNLGHTISVSSAVDIGTVIEIDLSQKRLEIE